MADASGLPIHTSRPTSPSAQREMFPFGLKVLYNPEDSTVDIIFIHGLGENRDEAWTSEQTSTLWPRDFLTSSIPDARVMTWGYDADLALPRCISRNRIGVWSGDLLRDLVKNREEGNSNDRPIIFVCHGVGGVVSQEALLGSEQSKIEEFHKIFRSTRGIIFVETPYYGNDFVREDFDLSISNPTVINYGSLALIQDDFCSMVSACNEERSKQRGLEPLQICSFSGKHPLRQFSQAVPWNAEDPPRYTLVSTWIVPMDIRKFEDPNDSGFQVIREQLQRLYSPIVIHDKSLEHKEKPKILLKNQQNLEYLERVSPPSLDMEDNEIRSLREDIGHLSSQESRNNIDVVQILEDKIAAALVSTVDGRSSEFIPRCQLRSIMNNAIISDLLVDCLRIRRGSELLESAVAQIHQSFYKIFAILVWIRSPSEIIRFIDDNVTDSDLPLKVSTNEEGRKVLQKSDPSKSACAFTAKWSSRKVQDFSRAQWIMIAPVFTCHDGTPSHSVLEEYQALPFMKILDRQYSANMRAGGFGSVRAVKIHPEHYDFGAYSMTSNSIFALKTLISNEKDGFSKEVEVLTRLNKNEHAHLIKLLATFEQQDSYGSFKYNLIFPWATGNLQDLWTDRHELAKSSQFAPWMAEQCKDLAFALSLIHNGQQNNTTSITIESELVYGRHGDIKPSNILWFADNIDGFDEKGSLVLSDFGLVSNHSLDSRSNSAASRVPVSPTYRAPESDMGGKISRSYDIWSLGCTFLDFVTWYLLGWEGVLKFAEERVENDDHFGLTTDTFFHMKKKHQPVVKRQVVRWVQSLHRNQQCTEYLHEFLTIIMEEMLVVDPAHRIRSQELTAALERIWKSCLEKEEYYTKHVPRKK